MSGHADVHVQPEDQERSRELLQLFDDAVVADARREDLILPVRERVRSRGRHREPSALRGSHQLVPDPEDLLAQLGDIRADPGADLDDRLVELALDLIAESRG